MTVYLEEQESARYRFGEEDRLLLAMLADRYIGANPPAPFLWRTVFRSGFAQTEDGLYEMDLGQRFPESRSGQWAYALGLVWSDGERNLDLAAECLGPVRLFHNGQLVFRSSVADELIPQARSRISVTFTKGWNSLFVKMQATAAGFGCRLGADEAKVRILNILSPFRERSGQAGWVYSAPMDEDRYAEGALPDGLATEQETGLAWLPQTAWTGGREGQPPLERLFGVRPGAKAYAWSRLEVDRVPGARAVPVRIAGESSGPAAVWIGGRKLVDRPDGGRFEQEIELPFGSHEVMAEIRCGTGGWSFRLEAACAGSPMPWKAPRRVQGTDEAWFYLGPLDEDLALQPEELASLHALAPLPSESGTEGGQTGWRLDLPDGWLRPYYENAMLSNKWTAGNMTNYARWDYPLGVTIYGLLQTGRLLGRPDMTAYAEGHVKACTDLFAYSLWDKERYGFPSINQQLVNMKMLDNCGSFGSAMLEAAKEQPRRLNAYVPEIAERIADFILNRLERKEDGVFFRLGEGEYFADTIWADDLYMSTPFLCRYAALTGQPGALDEAARQFRLFRSYLYIPEHRVMSHVYDFKYGRATGIPWGRGNGWTIFSLSEVLENLPEGHADRPFLLGFFQDLCEGYLALQGESGLWRQVLTDPDAYEEASCTAMFAYAFARGVRHGWFREPDAFARAAVKAWEGLTGRVIDRQGNVYGVCSGSRYSFTPDYYKEDLRTVTNDTHGIGIMLLAGAEVIRLQEQLAAGAPPEPEQAARPEEGAKR